MNKDLPAETLEIRLNKIAQASGNNIAFDSNLIKGIKVPALSTQNMTWEKVLSSTLSSTGFTYKKMADKSYGIVKKPAPVAKKVAGTIKGTVLDNQGLSLPGANIQVIGTGIGMQSDAEGNYSLALEPGTYTVEISFVSFQTQKVTGIQVSEGKATALNVVLKENTQDLEEVVITLNYKQASTAGLYAQQKRSTSITDGISADQMKRTGDNNVAQVLKRVAGVTMQDNKFIVVRGMSERYNNVQLNGSSLPSTEPNRRNFSFDIIPSNLVDNVVVAKTFTPDMSGEFSGGTVQVTTLSVPQEKFLTLALGNGYNTKSYGRDFWSNTRYAGDYLMGTNKRDWAQNNWAERYNTVYEDPLERGKVGAEIPNNWGLKKYNGNPTQNYAISGGIPFHLKDGSTLGLVSSITYRHEENREDYDWQSRFFTSSTDDGIKSSFVTVAAGLLNLGWKNKNNRIDWRNLYNRRFTHDNSRETDFDPTLGLDEQYQFRIVSSVRQNTLWQTRLEGEHKLWNRKLVATWFGDYNQLEREQPDDRFNRANILGTTADGDRVYKWRSSRETESLPLDAAGIFTSSLNEKKWNAGGNLEFTFDIAGNQQKIKTGYWGVFRTAGYTQSTLRIYQSGTQSSTIEPIQDLFSQQHFLDGSYYYKLITYAPVSGTGGTLANADSYSGHQDIHSGYLMGDFTFFKKLHLIGGARLESSKMEVNTITRYHKPGEDAIWTWTDSLMVYKENTWLPSVTATYDLLANLKFRAAYSRTLARADFRERSASMYYDLWERTMIQGSGSLKDAFSKNYDLRAEWYPAAGEIISISAFRKDLSNPVEIIATRLSGGEDQSNYVNLNTARVTGWELNLRKSFGFLMEDLKKLYLTANTTLLDGYVKTEATNIEGTVIEADKRDRLPNGLAEKNYNMGLAWDGEKTGISVNYNYIGHRITYAGSDEFLDQFEAGRGTLDAQLSFRTMKNKMELRFNASDLIAKPFIMYRNAYEFETPTTGGASIKRAINGKGFDEGEDVVLRKGRNGTTFSFSVAYTF